MLAEHEGRDWKQALTELVRWAGRKRPDNLLGAFKKTLADAPLLPGKEPPVPVSLADARAEKASTAAVEQFRTRCRRRRSRTGWRRCGWPASTTTP